MLRLGVGGLVLIGWLAIRRSLPVTSIKPEWWRRILITGAFTALFEGTYFAAINLTSVGFATLIAIGSTPVMVAAYTWARERGRPAPQLLVALGLALSGLFLLMSGSLDSGRNGLVGAALALVTGFAFAGITIVNKRALPGLPPVLLTGTAFTAGGLMLVPFAFFAGIGVPSDATGWALVAVLGVVVTALAYVFFLSGLRTVTPTVATVVTLLEPLVAAILGAIVLAERLGPTGIAGGALLGIAVLILRPQRDER